MVKVKWTYHVVGLGRGSKGEAEAQQGVVLLTPLLLTYVERDMSGYMSAPKSLFLCAHLERDMSGYMSAPKSLFLCAHLERDMSGYMSAPKSLFLCGHLEWVQGGACLGTQVNSKSLFLCAHLERDMSEYTGQLQVSVLLWTLREVVHKSAPSLCSSVLT